MESLRLMLVRLKQNLLLFVLARGFKQENYLLENNLFVFSRTNASFIYIIIWEQALFLFCYVDL